MSATISLNNWDHAGQIPVPVIASFSDKGQVKPIYVKIGEKELKIISCKNTTKEMFKQSPRFEVQVLDGNVTRTVHLVFHTTDFVWTARREDIGSLDSDGIC